MNHTTRRFPRTLAEAFPQERWPAVEIHLTARRQALRVLAWLALFLFIGGLMAWRM